MSDPNRTHRNDAQELNREVVIVFDHGIMDKTQVREAWQRLQAWLTSVTSTN